MNQNKMSGYGYGVVIGGYNPSIPTVDNSISKNTITAVDGIYGICMRENTYSNTIEQNVIAGYSATYHAVRGPNYYKP